MYDICLLHPHSQFLINEHALPPLGILYLSSSLKQIGFSCQCLDMAIGHSVNQIDSEVVGISFTSAQKEEAFRLADFLRHRQKTLIAGGAHPSHMPSECLKHFDYVIRGEADFQLPALLSRLNTVGEKDRILSNFEPQDLNLLPFPDRDALPIKQYNYTIDNEPATTVMTSRSCPYACSYCARISNKYRAQSAYRTVSEIRHVHDTYGFKAFMIFDDTFTANKERLREIVWLLKGKDYKFRCFSRSNLLTTDVCNMLSEMNVVEVGIGIESGSDDVLKFNMKGTSRRQNLDAVSNLRKVGIRVKAFIIIGLPGETKRSIEETKRWLELTKPDDVDFSVFQPMPGSDIFKNPSKYKVTIDYSLANLWYKGRPDLYKSAASTEGLKSEQIVAIRNEMETTYKKKELLR